MRYMLTILLLIASFNIVTIGWAEEKIEYPSSVEGYDMRRHYDGEEYKQTPELVREWESEIHSINMEYGRYAHIWNNEKAFPTEREKILINQIKDNHLRHHGYATYARSRFSYPPSMAFAKLFMQYGFNPNDTYYALTRAVNQQSRTLARAHLEGSLNITVSIKEYYDKYYDKIRVPISPWNFSYENSITLAKLYLSLGADIYIEREGGHANKYNAFSNSLRYYDFDCENCEQPTRPLEAFSPKLYAPFLDSTIKRYPHKLKQYRKTKVTDWLESFIESGYPSGMLDTHKLLYPHFMKGASVADVKDMLDNPQANAIKTNINCNYDKDEDEDETALVCPLTPSINMRDAMGRTPLHIAGEQGNQAVYDYLKNMGADTTIKDYRGNSPTL